MIRADLTVSCFPGLCEIRFNGPNAEKTHGLANKRPTYQAGDTPVDILARGKWSGRRFARFAGVVNLMCPAIPGAPKELLSTLICRWGLAFAVIEFQIDDTFYQISCRPRRGVANWARQRFAGLPGPLSEVSPITTRHRVANHPVLLRPPINDAPNPVYASSPFGGERLVASVFDGDRNSF